MLPRLLLAPLIAALCLFSLREVTAQSTPEAGQPGCTVEPRTEAEVARLQATPAEETPAATPESPRPVDEETLAELQRVIAMADACAAQGEYDRLAALYSDSAIQAGVLDEEGVPIVAGTPAATPSSTPPGKFGPPTVSSAYWIDGSHVLAELQRGSSIRELRFVQEDDRWLIDSNETITSDVVEDFPATPDMSAVLPLPVLQSIVDLVANETGDEVQSITITSVEEVDWPDTFLGCPVEGGFAAQVITPGYRVTVEYEGEQFEVHTDMDGHAVTC